VWVVKNCADQRALQFLGSLVSKKSHVQQFAILMSVRVH